MWFFSGKNEAAQQRGAGSGTTPRADASKKRPGAGNEFRLKFNKRLGVYQLKVLAWSF